MFYVNERQYTVLLSHPSGVGSVTLRPGQAVRGKFFSMYGYLTPAETVDAKVEIAYDQEAVDADHVPAQIAVPVVLPHVVTVETSSAAHASTQAPQETPPVEEVAPKKKTVKKKVAPTPEAPKEGPVGNN